LTLALFRCSLV